LLGRNDRGRVVIDTACGYRRGIPDGKTVHEIQLTAGNTIAELLARYPVAARVLVDRRMHCVGCDIASFETIGDACAIYGVAVDELFADIRNAVPRGEGSSR
jgi:hybrid cluster-associated redox disulfide protein